MNVIRFTVIFDQPNKVYHPGQNITGRVELVTKSKQKIRGVELKIKGRGKCELLNGKDRADVERRSANEWPRLATIEKEVYFRKEIVLYGGKGTGIFKLSVGIHSYPFAVMLPYKIPSTFKGTHGEIMYYAKVKIGISLACDKEIKQQFIVKNFLDLNHFPSLRIPFTTEENKIFHYWCCTSGPLTITARLPRTGYVKCASIPITLEVDNGSNIDVDSIHVYFERNLNWRARESSKHESVRAPELFFGSIWSGQSKIWNEIINLPSNTYPYLEGCSIMKINYEIYIRVKISGTHPDMEMHIPLTIGDIPFNEEPICANGQCKSAWAAEAPGPAGPEPWLTQNRQGLAPALLEAFF